MAAYLVCLTTLMAATHLVHVTMDTPSSTSLSSTVDQPRPLTLLHRVEMDSNWKEVTMDSLGSNSMWEWPGMKQQHYAGIQDRQDCTALENRPHFPCDPFPSDGLDQVHHTTVTLACGTHVTAGNTTPPLIPLDYYQQYPRGNGLDTWYDYFLHELWEWLEWSSDRSIDLSNTVGKDTTETVGTNPSTLDLITSNDSELSTRTDTSTVQAIVCRERPEVGMRFPICSLSS